MNRLSHFLRYMGLHKGARFELRHEKRNVYRLLGRLILVYSHLQVPYQTFSSVLPLKALQVALHFSRLVLISSTETFLLATVQHFQPLSQSKFIPSEYCDVNRKAWFSLAQKHKHQPKHKHQHMCKQVKTGST